MKGFLILAYHNSKKENVSVTALESELSRKKLSFSKKKLSNVQYDQVLGFQFYKSNDPHNNIDDVHFIAGDIYGKIEDQNQNLLSYIEASSLVKNSTIERNYLALEGNACIASVFPEKIVFQNDIEGYRKIFYFQKNRILCISTDLPLILKAVKQQWRIRRNAVISLIASRESKWPLTFIEDVFTLPPISRTEISFNSFGIISKSFSDFYQLQKISKNNLREQLYSQYELIAQRKMGKNTAVTLSGGYDSNCLTKLYSQAFPGQFSAVSVGYEAKRERDGNIYNETIYAEKIAEKLNIPFKKYFFTQDDFFSGFDSFVEAIDQPGHDPSSNFIMNKHLRSDGFDLVVNGMGGDGNFASKRYIRLAMKSHSMYKTLPGKTLLNVIAARLNFRGPFSYFKVLIKKPEESSFHDLWERKQLFSHPINHFISHETKLIIDSERNLRADHFNRLISRAKTEQEIFYSLAIFCNPDEYHATISAEKNDMEILMPFVNSKVALAVMNGSKYHRIDSRQFEMDIFGGIEKDLLAKSKSGFSIPYSEWLPAYSEKIFGFFIELDFFERKSFDIKSFRKRYKTEDSFASAAMANSVLWKLMVVKEYIKKHELN